MKVTVHSGLRSSFGFLKTATTKLTCLVGFYLTVTTLWDSHILTSPRITFRFTRNLSCLRIPCWMWNASRRRNTRRKRPGRPRRTVDHWAYEARLGIHEAGTHRDQLLKQPTFSFFGRSVGTFFFNPSNPDVSLIFYDVEEHSRLRVSVSAIF